MSGYSCFILSNDVQALRHYEKIKLLVPEIIDYSTGYRYYSVRQMQKALNIVRLKGLGFSLSAMITFQKKVNEMHEIYIDSLPAIIVGRLPGYVCL